MRVQEINLQISGYQSVFRVNVRDFGYSETEKLEFINDLLLGHIGREDLMRRATEDNAAALSLWTGSRQNFSGQLSGTDCKLQGVFVGSLESLNKQDNLQGSQSEDGVFMIPLSGSENSDKTQTTRKFQTQSVHVVDSLYQHLGKQETSVAKGELHCSKQGSTLQLAEPHLKKSSFKLFENHQQEKSYSKSPKRSRKRGHERRKTQSIQPGIVRRLREKFGGDGASNASESAENKHLAFKPSCLNHSGNVSSSCVSKSIENRRKVDVAINTDKSYLSDIRSSFQNKNSAFLRPKTERQLHFSKNAESCSQKIVKPAPSSKHCKLATRKPCSFTVPSPSTGNSLAYNYWALSDSPYHESIAYDKEEQDQDEYFPSSQIAWQEKDCDVSFYEDSLGLDPASYFDQSDIDCASELQHSVTCPVCAASSCSSSSSLCTNHAGYERRKSAERPYSRPNSFHIAQRQNKEDITRTSFGRKQPQRKSYFETWRPKEKSKENRSRISGDASTSVLWEPHPTRSHLHQPASPGPRVVDFLEYPFSATSSAEDYDEIDELSKITATRSSGLTLSKSNLLGKVGAKSLNEAESWLSFEELKKENENFMKLRKKFSRGLRLNEANESDESISDNPEKIAYNRQVQRFTKPPPALKPKTSLTLDDQRDMGLRRNPEPSGDMTNQKAGHPSKIHTKRKQSFGLKREPKMNRIRKPVSKDIDGRGFSSPSDYYIAPQPSARSPQKHGVGIPHRKKNLSRVPITKKSFSKSACKTVFNADDTCRSDTGSPHVKPDQNCRKKYAAKHIHPAEKPEAEYLNCCKHPNKVTLQTGDDKAKKVIIKRGNPLNKAQMTETKDCVGDHSKSQSNRQLKALSSTTMQKAILCAQECPQPFIGRREWDAGDMGLGDPMVDIHARCNQKTGS